MLRKLFFRNQVRRKFGEPKIVYRILDLTIYSLWFCFLFTLIVAGGIFGLVSYLDIQNINAIVFLNMVATVGYIFLYGCIYNFLTEEYHHMGAAATWIGIFSGLIEWLTIPSSLVMLSLIFGTNFWPSLFTLVISLVALVLTYLFLFGVPQKVEEEK